jgi:alkanesulfonate monooxygenase SsuD/methylene tetrahydromethanopterin reductase-like flavin-dependent oxidoreductase (luciferase family)
MKVGVKLNAPIREVRWSDIRDMALTAEAAGFDSLWTEDHQWGPRRGGDPWEAWSVLSALAAITRRVELGPIVASTNFHAPGILARKAAAVQEISGGRLILGIGAGSAPVEYPMLGLPIDHPVSRFEESFEIMRRLFAGERFAYAGRFHTLAETWLANAPEEPMRWMIGSQGPRMLRLTLPHVEGWNTHWSEPGCWNRPEGFAAHSRAVDERCAEVGVDPTGVWRSVEIYVAVDGAHGLPVDLPDEFIPIRGSADEIAASLAAFDEAGADLVQVLIDPQTPAAVELLAEAVNRYRGAHRPSERSR